MCGCDRDRREHSRIRVGDAKVLILKDLRSMRVRLSVSLGENGYRGKEQEDRCRPGKHVVIVAPALHRERGSASGYHGRMPTRSSHTTRILIAFGCVYFFWGSTYVAIRFGVEVRPPFVLASGRSLIAGPLMRAL